MIHIDTLHIETQGVIPEQSLKEMTLRNRRGFNTFSTYTGSTYRTYDGRYDNVFIKHTVESQKIKIEIDSCGGFLHGNSMIPIGDEQSGHFLERLEGFLLETTNVSLMVPLRDAQIKRMDIKYDFQVGDEVRDYLSAIAKHSVPGHQRDILGNGDTVVFKNSSRKMMFYNREANCINRRKSEEETEMSKGVIRFEVACNSAELLRRLKLNTVCINDVFNSNVTEDLLRRYFDKVRFIDRVTSTESELLRILQDNFGENKGYRILSYIKAKQDGNLSGFSRTTIYEYEKLLEEKGIASVIGERRQDCAAMILNT
ncbi:hypothetical protein QP794_28230 [Paenibacillus sp. UMB7766-LJ446]|uniref:hypothetical protein n=1 Tax=Paenibacillus sp. UMB7766-LJ446 TaxID=3046313 RepID=UPI00254F7C9C|nr:hypothetical protein [Paenibacillus sp. UMB7766-LJ446]MDK8193975.1 hypothetical protein [Paenibacillus sp. UMB7766-LJ446]